MYEDAQNAVSNAVKNLNPLSGIQDSINQMSDVAQGTVTGLGMAKDIAINQMSDTITSDIKIGAKAIAWYVGFAAVFVVLIYVLITGDTQLPGRG